MNKLVTVFGVAAVASLAGCKDPNYRPMSDSQDEVKIVETTPKTIVATDPTPEKPTCKCPPGTKHTSPCACGAPDCQCVVEVKPLPPPPPPPPETTTYIVQRGDYLAKISKKYNVTIDSIKKLNGMKNDTIRIGQKLQLPGKIDVGVQKAPVQAAAPKKAASAPVDYTGETKEYVVKSGDTLGAIAYGNGCNIRQLKKLNGLTSDSLKIGQKLKVPSGKAAVKEAKPANAPVPAPAETQKATAPKAPENPPAPAAEAKPVPPPAPVVEPPKDPEPVVEPPVAAPADPQPAAGQSLTTYTVQEGDDMTGVSIRFGVTAAVIRELNKLPEGAQLTVGQVIKLPAEAQQ